MTEAEQFLSRFNFRKDRAGWLGFEREYFLLGSDGAPAPESPRFLESLSPEARPEWTYELSACQVEHHPGPFSALADFEAALRRGEGAGRQTARSLGLTLTVREVGPANMTTAVYPHDARYAGIKQEIPRPVLLAACRVTSTQIHYGAASLEHAISVLNRLIPHLDEFIAAGDSSGGERLRLYRTMAPWSEPRRIASAGHFIETVLADIKASGSTDPTNPRNCWHLIRISRHGSVEVRAFGSTKDRERILGWARRIKELGDSA